MDDMVTLAMILALATICTFTLASCRRGIRIPGPSWFEISHDTNRASRRARR